MTLVEKVQHMLGQLSRHANGGMGSEANAGQHVSICFFRMRRNKSGWAAAGHQKFEPGEATRVQQEANETTGLLAVALSNQLCSRNIDVAHTLHKRRLAAPTASTTVPEAAQPNLPLHFAAVQMSRYQFQKQNQFLLARIP